MRSIFSLVASQQATPSAATASASSAVACAASAACKAVEAFAELARIGDAIGFRNVVQAKCQLAGLLKIQGRLHQAAGLYREALQVWAEGGGQQLGTSGTVAVGMGDLLREQNDLEAARHYAMDGIEHMPWTEHLRWWENPHDLAFGYMTLARIHQAQGDLDGAADAIQQAEELKDKYSSDNLEMAFMEATRIG